jgi:hypothetical protein
MREATPFKRCCTGLAVMRNTCICSCIGGSMYWVCIPCQVCPRLYFCSLKSGMLAYKPLPVQHFGCSYVQNACNSWCPSYKKDKYTRREVMLVSGFPLRISLENAGWRDVSNDTSFLPFVQAHNKLLDSTVTLETLRLLHSISRAMRAYTAR